MHSGSVGAQTVRTGPARKVWPRQRLAKWVYKEKKKARKRCVFPLRRSVGHVWRYVGVVGQWAGRGEEGKRAGGRAREGVRPANCGRWRSTTTT